MKKNEETSRDLWNNLKSKYMGHWIQEALEKDKGIESLFEETIA